MPLDSTDVTALSVLAPLAPVQLTDELPIYRPGSSLPLQRCQVSDIGALIIGEELPFYIVAGTGLSGGDVGDGQTIAIEATGVAAGAYIEPFITVNAEGQVTAAANGFVGVAFNCVGAPPLASELFDGFTSPRTLTFPANFAGAAGPPASPQSYGRIVTNPTATFTIAVEVNGSSVGTIEISPAGAFTFATAGGATFTMNPGDLMTLTAQASPDATAANIFPTLCATLES